MTGAGSSPARRYKTARSTLIILIALTALNLVLLLLKSRRYYLCSIYLAYWLAGPTLPGVLLPLGLMALYGAVYVLSGRRGGWLVAGAAFYLLDTVFVLVLSMGFVAVGDKAALFAPNTELLLHLAFDILLILGLKGRKVGTMSDEELLSAESAEAGLYPEISCTVSVSDDGTPGTLSTPGFIRFEPEELVVSAQSVSASILAGSMLAREKEAVRVPYGSICAASYLTKRESGVQLDLEGGRILCLVFLGQADRDRFLKLMAARGAVLPRPAGD